MNSSCAEDSSPHLQECLALCDVSSPPRKIEVKAFGGSARGASIPLEDRQVKAAREDPEHFYLYVVDNIAAGEQKKVAVRALHGPTLRAMLDRAVPRTTY